MSTESNTESGPEPNINHEQDVEASSSSYSERTLSRGRKAVIDYLRDCKAPQHKRSMSHLWEHFSSETREDDGRYDAPTGTKYARFPRMLIGRVVEALIDENQLYCLRDGGAVGGGNDGPRVGPLPCNDRDWIVYNPYPHQKRKQDKALAVHAATHDKSEEARKAGIQAAGSVSAYIQQKRAKPGLTTCTGEKPYPCLDPQIHYQGPEGKWTQGGARPLTDFDHKLRAGTLWDTL
jgi:hypothetical protein